MQAIAEDKGRHIGDEVEGAVLTALFQRRLPADIHEGGQLAALLAAALLFLKPARDLDDLLRKLAMAAPAAPPCRLTINTEERNLTRKVTQALKGGEFPLLYQ